MGGGALKILVTGATGFIGRHLLAELLARGHTVTALTRKDPGTDGGPRVQWIVHDIESGDSNVELAGHDALAHLAWPDLPNYDRPSHVERTLPAHCRFIGDLVENGLPQVLVAGTCLEYGLREGCLSEAMTPQPTLAYAVAKDALRKYLEALRARHCFSLQWARLFYMFGPGQNPRSLLALVDQAIADGRESLDMSGGEQLRDYLPVQEVARGLATLLEHPDMTDVTNICSGRPVSVRSLVEQRIRERGAALRMNLGVLPYPSYEAMAFWGDATRLSSLYESAAQSRSPSHQARI